MRIVILNWSAGENDPFTYFSRQWQDRLRTIGHEVHIVPLAQQTILAVASLHHEVPIDLAFCWQGLGSDLVPDGFEQPLWELLRVPLICLHGDHPCYNPANHKQRTPFVLHLYGPASHANSANRLIPRDTPAIEGIYPSLFEKAAVQSAFEGEFFVLSKNIQDLADIRSEWKARYDADIYTLLTGMAGAIERAYLDGNHVNHHDVILDRSPARLREQILAGQLDATTADWYFGVTRELDRVHRIVAATFILDALSNVPIHVYGRGWERYKARGNANHQFFAADTVENSGHHYASAWGILDVAASNDMLHDRTYRAMQLGTGFLLSSAWMRGHPLHDDFADLFFGGNAEDLVRKVAIVQRDPAAHRASCATFEARLEAATLSTAAFLEQIELHVAVRALR